MVKKKLIAKSVPAAGSGDDKTTSTAEAPATTSSSKSSTQPTKDKDAAAVPARQLRQRVVQEPADPAPASTVAVKKPTATLVIASDLATPGKRPKLKAVSTNVPAKEKSSEDAESQAPKAVESKEVDEQENIGLFEFHNKIKRHCILSDKWVLFEPRMDPELDQNVILVLEMDITIEGDLRVKRSVKVGLVSCLIFSINSYFNWMYNI